MDRDYENVEVGIVEQLEADIKRLKAALGVFDEMTFGTRTYHVMHRENSVCVYYTQPFSGAHWVVYDSLDDKA